MAASVSAPDVSAIRGQLVHSLKTTGTLDSLKSQVRSHLLHELKRTGAATLQPPQKSTSLQQRALDSLVLAHLRASAYEYTASVLAPEAGLTDGALDYPDICKALGLPAQYNAAPMPSPTSSQSPLAAALAAAAAAAEEQSSRHSAAANASSSSAGNPDSALVRASLETQLRRVDEAAALAKAEGAPPPSHALQEHMLRYQREVDERAQQQLAAEVRRLREVGGTSARRSAEPRVQKSIACWVSSSSGKRSIAGMRRREAGANESLRRREAAFEAPATSISNVCSARSNLCALASATATSPGQDASPARPGGAARIAAGDDRTRSGAATRAHEVELESAQSGSPPPSASSASLISTECSSWRDSRARWRNNSRWRMRSATGMRAARPRDARARAVGDGAGGLRAKDEQLAALGAGGVRSRRSCPHSENALSCSSSRRQRLHSPRPTAVRRRWRRSLPRSSSPPRRASRRARRSCSNLRRRCARRVANSSRRRRSMPRSCARPASRRARQSRSRHGTLPRLRPTASTRARGRRMRRPSSTMRNREVRSRASSSAAARWSARSNHCGANSPRHEAREDRDARPG